MFFRENNPPCFSPQHLHQHAHSTRALWSWDVGSSSHNSNHWLHGSAPVLSSRLDWPGLEWRHCFWNRTLLDHFLLCIPLLGSPEIPQRSCWIHTCKPLACNFKQAKPKGLVSNVAESAEGRQSHLLKDKEPCFHIAYVQESLLVEANFTNIAINFILKKYESS